MRMLDYNEFKICQALGRLFEKSVDLSTLSSPLFIRRFMNYKGPNMFLNKTFLILSTPEENVIYDFNEIYEPSKHKKTYSKDQMYWIGYIYGTLAFLYEKTFSYIYKLFPANEIVKYYPIYHTFGIEQAAERMMENINYKEEDLNDKGKRILRRLMLQEKLQKLIGQKIKVYIDRPIGFEHKITDKNVSVVYPVNYGYIKEYIADDKEYQDAYVLGVEEPLEEFEGIVYAIIFRKDDYEDKLIVVKEGTTYTDQDIKDKINFVEKYYKYKILRK